MSDDNTEQEINATPSVVALQYDGEQAPKVAAKGHGVVAEQILALAEEHDIPLHEDPDLVTLLSKLDLGTEIPSNLYIAVAEILAFAYMISGKTPRSEE
ncbi:MAG: EscU/YscU/HrcU family type III secretion system export apparatus switch protein [Gammaproteobacteria bacterium]|nr:EscU/YscU/HrcU family type III secretion system export apparatus switch protein [Gammaproteobacteria bacterium]